ncbi:LysR substrate-binding domain-containing protein [Chromobacterium vaccinii]|uniref:LysR substrate-binding domain-containing protein n=1 Tax=Chromobacterium vaccinii TaxID=1108595 RepID=UPI001E4AA6E7|nr:LysR substrate-binding domain-containing protein [Chromobacterium vaccinii]MCD4486334.1 LysR substrate-binding domain-containing protein [Chromobacterium vaccinii]
MGMALPPLSALRAFVAVARLGSVVAAAEELHVTHGAVSHQLRSLEEYLGVALLNRKGRRTSLTEEGRIYAYQIRQALDNVSLISDRLRKRGGTQRLRVSVLPSFATHWLVPRLGDWLRHHPDLGLSLDASMAFADFEPEALDCAIRFGHGDWPDVHARRLMGDSLLLVASPRLFPEGAPSLVRALEAPILQASESWESWLAGAEGGLPPLSPPALEFTDSTQMLEAARQGLGVALTRRSIADALLSRGELVLASEREAAHSSAYYLVWPHRSHGSPRLARFLDWLLSQAEDFQRSLPGQAPPASSP